MSVPNRELGGGGLVGGGIEPCSHVSPVAFNWRQYKEVYKGEESGCERRGTSFSHWRLICRLVFLNTRAPLTCHWQPTCRVSGECAACVSDGFWPADHLKMQNVFILNIQPSTFKKKKKTTKSSFKRKKKVRQKREEFLARDYLQSQREDANWSFFVLRHVKLQREDNVKHFRWKINAWRPGWNNWNFQRIKSWVFSVAQWCRCRLWRETRPHSWYFEHSAGVDCDPAPCLLPVYKSNEREWTHSHKHTRMPTVAAWWTCPSILPVQLLKGTCIYGPLSKQCGCRRPPLSANRPSCWWDWCHTESEQATVTRGRHKQKQCK